ncbi:MAG TPA: cupin domain-containing protein [Candidatus Binatia bacterium]
MSLRPKEEIGEETHTLDQFIRVEAGRGVAILDGVKHQISDGTAVVIPAGTKHNIRRDDTFTTTARVIRANVRRSMFVKKKWPGNSARRSA